MPGSNPGTFIKTGPAADLAMFEAEADGLRELGKAGAIRVPEVLDVGVRDGRSYIVMERLRLKSPTADVEILMGEALARLHDVTAERYGWFRDNTIGPTPQMNRQSDDWGKFFAEQRLAFQLELAESQGYGGELQDAGWKLVEGLPRLFDDYAPKASLLHGDLWGGNWGAADGEPVVFDPAVYFGDRETDLAMMKLFGGFGQRVFSAYEKACPLAPGSEARIDLYQLYHVLNHLNLFGSGYREHALRLMRRLLAGKPG